MSKPTNLASRAICCLCGSIRKVDGRTRLDDIDAPERVSTLACERCDTDTPHARIGGRRPDRPFTVPTAATFARKRFDALVRRLAAFNVDVTFGSCSERYREKGFVIGYKYDADADRWSIEVDPNLPPAVATAMVTTAWKRIATDSHRVDWDAREGVILSATDEQWAADAELLAADIRDAMPHERERLLAAVRDQHGIEVDHLPNAAVMTADDLADDAAQRAAAMLRELGEEGTQ